MFMRAYREITFKYRLNMNGFLRECGLLMTLAFRRNRCIYCVINLIMFIKIIQINL